MSSTQTREPADSADELRDLLQSVEEGDELTIQCKGDERRVRVNREVYVVDETSFTLGDPGEPVSYLVYPERLTMEEMPDDPEELRQNQMDIERVWVWSQLEEKTDG